MAPLAWIRRIADEMPELKQIPLFGNAPPFDWHRLSSMVASRFGVPHFKIHAREHEWREGSSIKKGLGTNTIILPISVAPLGTVFWIMSQEDMIKLTSWLMKPNHKARALSSEILQEGFYRYLALEALDAIQSAPPFEQLTLQLTEDEGPSDRAFCIDVEMELENKSSWGRIAIPETFRSTWVQHFSKLTTVYFSTELAKQTELVIGVKTGSVILHQDEWKKLHEGDFILLDQGAYDAHKGTGAALLMLQATPLFNVKVKHNKIELIDYAFYYEDTMDTKQPNNETPPASEGEVIALKELPLYVTVEVARLKITLDQLMHLVPGNTLELPVHPDQGVSLTVNGQTVGRAELVYLGEQLGVRILEIGK